MVGLFGPDRKLDGLALNLNFIVIAHSNSKSYLNLNLLTIWYVQYPQDTKLRNIKATTWELEMYVLFSNESYHGTYLTYVLHNSLAFEVT